MTPTPQDLLDLARRHTNVLLLGAPATGKSFLMQQAREAFLAGAAGDQDEVGLAIDTQEEDEPIVEAVGGNRRVAWVTFHQSYSYEDFILGLRPALGGANAMQLSAVPGVLLRLAAHAMQPGHESLLIIDEVNRGNASRVFGEFITLLERDKRLQHDGTPSALTVQVELPYLGTGEQLAVTLEDGTDVLLDRQFALPLRLYTIAAMNTVDKSVAPLDVALRRRFHTLNLTPSVDALGQAAGIGTDDEDSEIEEVRQVAVDLVRHLNDHIAHFVAPDMQLGQWYLTPLRNPEAGRADLVEVWRTRLLPQLDEILASEAEQIAAVLKLTSTTAPLRVIAPPRRLEHLGALPFIERVSDDVQTEYEMLRNLVVEAPQDDLAGFEEPLPEDEGDGTSAEVAGPEPGDAD